MYVVELPLGDDLSETVAVHVAEIDEGLVPAAAPGQRVTVRASRSLAAMLDAVRPVAQRFVESYQQVSQVPSEITVQFGISVSADADVMVARTAGEAHFSVALTWKKPDGSDDSRGSREG